MKPIKWSKKFSDETGDYWNFLKKISDEYAIDGEIHRRPNTQAFTVSVGLGPDRPRQLKSSARHIDDAKRVAQTLAERLLAQEIVIVTRKLSKVTKYLRTK